MADNHSAEQITSAPADIADAVKAQPKKRKTTAAKKASARPKAADAAPVPAKVKPRRYSESERAELIARIEAQASTGQTLKTAIKEAGIAEQTYYQWKRATAVTDTAEATIEVATETYEDLVALEEENNRLRLKLAEKLRTENADLRRRLGLD